MHLQSPRNWSKLLFIVILCAPMPALASDYATTYQECMKTFKNQPPETSFCAVETCAYRACVAAQRLSLFNGDVVVSGGRLTTVPAECSPYIDAMQRCIVDYLNTAIDSRSHQDITGIWAITQTNGFQGTLNFKQDASNHLTGSASFNRGLSGSIKGKVSGNSVEFTITYSASLSGSYSGTLSKDGTSMKSGGTSSSTGDSAGWEAKR